jgi:uncharacterized protein
VRVRHLADRARIEVGADELARLDDPDLRTRVISRIGEQGFDSVELDPEPYRTGRLNDDLPGDTDPGAEE